MNENDKKPRSRAGRACICVLFAGCLFVLGGCQKPASRASIVPQAPASCSTLKSRVIEILQTVKNKERLDRQAVIPVLLEALRSPDREVRLASVLALDSMDPPPAEAVPALLAALDDSDLAVRNWASDGLSRLTPDSIPGLIQALKSREARRRLWAAATLGRIGPPAQLAIPELIGALKDRGEVEFSLDARTIEQMARLLTAPRGSKLSLDRQPMVVERLKIRGAAAVALGRIGSANPPVIAALVQLLWDDEDVAVRAAAASALGHLGPGAREAAPALLEALHDKEIASTAAAALAKIDPPTAIRSRTR